MRYKVAIRFAVEGDVRFISHHDMMRLFERALSRSELPVRFSEGFNPRPKMSLPLPRPVGIATQADVLVVSLTREVACEEVLRQLGAQMPGGVVLRDAWTLQSSRPIQPETASYAVDLSDAEIPAVNEHLSRLLAAESWPVQRGADQSGPAKLLDLRAQLAGAELDRHTLSWTVRFGDGGSVRPGEVLTAMGIDPDKWLHRVSRTAIAWRTEPTGAPEPD